MGNLRFWIYRKRTEEELIKIFNEFEYKLVTSYAMYEYAYYDLIHIDKLTQTALCYQFKRKSIENIDLNAYQLRPPSNMLNPFTQRGFEIHRGWYDLVWELSQKLDQINPDIRITQIKEKFGLLRIYADSSTEEQQRLISLYSAKTDIICENCGKLVETGTLRKIKNVLVGICDDCIESYVNAKWEKMIT